MAIDYTALKANLVIPKITEYGKSVILRSPGSNAAYTKSYDPGRGSYKWTLIAAPFTVVYTDPALTTTDVAGHAVETKFETAEIDGTTVLSSDRKFLTADLTPTTASKLVVDSKELTIVSVKTTEPGSVALLYTLQCRL